MIIVALIASTIDYAPALTPLAPLVGHCWSTRVSKDSIDRHCFHSIYDGKHIRDEHVVTRNGQPVYSGETVYSAEALALAFTYINSLGGVGRGTVTPVGSDLQFHLNMRAAPSANPQSIESKWRIAHNGYAVTSTDGVRQFQLDDH